MALRPKQQFLDNRYRLLLAMPEVEAWKATPRTNTPPETDLDVASRRRHKRCLERHYERSHSTHSASPDSIADDKLAEIRERRQFWDTLEPADR